MHKPFKNRITQEDENTLKKLKSTYINMNEDKKLTPTTPEGLFFISIQPNTFTDEVRLEADFRFILSLYYHWRYGSKWTSLKRLQHAFKGIIERQEGFYHIHFITYNENMEELAMFCGYIKATFKSLYPKASFDVRRVYDLDGCLDYIGGNKKKKRTSVPIVITDRMFQVRINGKNDTWWTYQHS